MRHISPPFLVFLVIVLDACGPDLPGLGEASPPADAREDRSVEVTDGHLRATPPPDAAPSRPDAAALEVRADLGPSEARPDAGAAETRPDAGAAEARPDAGAAEARPDASATDVRPDAGPPSDGAVDLSPDGPIARAPRPGEIRIVEVLVDPDGNDLGHEWFEIVNLTGEPLSLTDLHVADGATDVAAGAGAILVLSAGARLVLGQSLDRAHNGDAPVDVSYGTRLALNNDADRIAICLGTCAEGGVLDAFDWSGLGTAFAGHALVIQPESGETCAAATPYGAGGNFGTPGQANPPCPAPLEMPKLPRG